MSRSGPVASYLERYFVDHATLAELAGISEDRLDQLVKAGAVPQPSYICRGNVMCSAALGQTTIEEQLWGQYFRPDCLKWITTAERAKPGEARNAVLQQLTDELTSALRLSGLAPSEVAAKVQDYLPSFWNGTFGLSVADPSTGAGIVAKERLQESLVRLTADGTDPSPPGISQAELLALIDTYALVTMPCSPAEYENSSRKRLVDDYRRAVIAI